MGAYLDRIMMGEDESGMPIPPPMRIVRDGWFGRRDLTHTEAEAYHLREAARLVGSPMLNDQVRQASHLAEAERNRAYGRLNIPTPAGTVTFCEGVVKKGGQNPPPTSYRPPPPQSFGPRPALTRPIQKGT